MKKLLIILSLIFVISAPSFAQVDGGAGVLAWLRVLDWVQADSIYTRALTSVSQTFTTLTVSDSAYIDTLETYDLNINSTVADQETPTFSISGDADSDASATTSETLGLTLAANADPTKADWSFTGNRFLFTSNNTTPIVEFASSSGAHSWVDIDAGGDHMMAMRTRNGGSILWMWGRNSSDGFSK